MDSLYVNSFVPGVNRHHRRSSVCFLRFVICICYCLAAMSENERMRSIRGDHRGVVMKIVREVDGLLTTDGPMIPERATQLHIKLQQLEAKLKVLSDIDKDILSKCDVGEIEHEIDELEATTAKIMNCQQKIHKAIRAPTEPSVVHTPTAVPTSTPTKPKLPKLTLPKFKGELTSWTTFWDSFKSTVHENPNMSKIDKFSYLKSLMEGSAASCIQGLTLSEANYDAAITMLQERFGRPQQIITAHMEELLRIGSTGDRPSSLRSTFDKIMVHVRGLGSLGIGSEQYGSLLIPVIMSKFPNEVCLRAAHETNRMCGRLRGYCELLSKKWKPGKQVKEHVSILVEQLSFPTGLQLNSNPTTGSFVTNSTGIRCVYCNGDHFSASCTKVVSVKDRRDILKRSGRCYNCLRSHHKSKDCDSRKTCRYCRRRHHQSICEHSGNANATPNVNPPTPNPPAQDPPAQNPQSQTVTTSSCNKIPNNQTVLLQTARAIATSLYGTVPIRALLDNGSQLSYITTSLQSRLRLEPIRRREITFEHLWE